jgi:hypothetical protein
MAMIFGHHLECPFADHFFTSVTWLAAQEARKVRVSHFSTLGGIAQIRSGRSSR